MKFVGWELYNMKFVCYIAGAISKDLVINVIPVYRQSQAISLI